MSENDLLNERLCKAPDCSTTIRIRVGNGDEQVTVTTPEDPAFGTRYCSRECAIRGLADEADGIDHVAIYRADGGGDGTT